MKKLGVIILSIVYFILSTGIIITLHYCHNHFSDFKVYGTYDDNCCGPSHGFSHECCTFETISGKITQEHVYSEKNLIISPKEFLFSIFSFQPKLEEELIILRPIIFCASPPNDIPIVFCTLTFYG